MTGSAELTESLRVPELFAGEGEVTVGGHLVDEGERFFAGDRLVELLQPGVLYDVSAPAAGRVVSWTLRRGDTAAAGGVLAILEPADQPEGD